MTQIYIVRHAQSTGNIEKRLTGREDYPLTEKGKEQVKCLVKRLRPIHFDYICSSPSIRAIETVKEVAQENNLNVETFTELSEMYFGIYDGWKWEDVNKENPNIKQNQIKTNEIDGIRGEETLNQVGDRMMHFITEIAEKNKQKTILIASHGVAIEAFLRQITRIPFAQEREEYSQKNTSLNLVYYEEEKKEFKIEILNDSKHLEFVEEDKKN